MQTSARTTAPSPTFPSFPRHLNGWFPCNFFLILSSQDFCLLVSLDLGLITQLKLSFSPFCLTSTLLLIDPNLRCWLYMMFQPLLTWLTMTSCYWAYKPLVESEATLFSGSSPILVVALTWLSVETLDLLGSLSNMEFRRVESLVLSFTCYIQPTFQPYSPNTPHLVTSMLMMCRRSSMVHLLISSLLLAALMLSLKICTSGCLPIGYR